MYMIINKLGLTEFRYSGETKPWHEALTVHLDKERIALFQHRLDARLFLSVQKYRNNNNLADFVEIPVTDSRAERHFNTGNLSFGLVIMNADTGDMGSAILVDRKDFEKNLHEASIKAYGSPEEVAQRQQVYNAMSEEDLENEIVRIVFKGDAAKKLILDTNKYSNYIDHEKKKYQEVCKYLAEKEILNHLPLYVFVDENKQPYFEAGMYPVFYMNILDAYIAKFSGKFNPKDFQVCNLHSPEMLSVKNKLYAYCKAQGFVYVCLGLTGRYDSTTGKVDFCGLPDRPEFYIVKENIAVIENGFNAVDVFANIMIDDMEDDREARLEAFFQTQKFSALELEGRAHKLYENFHDLTPSKPDDVLMPRMLF